MFPLERLQNALHAHRVQCPDTIESSIAEYLFETVSSKEVSLGEKITTICDTVPALYNLKRAEIEDILSEMAFDKSPPRPMRNAERKVSQPKSQSPSKEEKSESNASEVADEVAIEIRRSLNYHCVDGVDLVEDELVEYMLTFVNELESEGAFLSEVERTMTGDFLQSFFEDVERSPDCLREIIDILHNAVVKRKPRKSSQSPVQRTISAASAHNSNSRSTKIVQISSSKSETDERQSAQALEDISSLTSMMPHTPDETIHYVYTVLCASNRIEAAQYLADRCDDESVRKLEESRYAYDKKEKESANISAAQQKKMKDRLCDRYGEKEVAGKYDSKGKVIKATAKLPVQFVDIESKDKKVRRVIFSVLKFDINRLILDCMRNHNKPNYITLTFRRFATSRTTSSATRVKNQLLSIAL